MNKRQFLASAAIAATLPAAPAVAVASAGKGPALLTISGAIGKTSRGQFDPALDQMLKIRRQGTRAARSAAGGRAGAGGGTTGARSTLALRAVDGYVVSISAAQARTQRFIVATHLDGQPMGLGSLGPLWAVIDADRIAELAARPLAERFGACPWALYHIDVAGSVR